MARILVVEDDRQLSRALGINLKARGYDVGVAHDGTSALRAAAETPQDLVVLDLGLPDIDGVDVVRGLRGWTAVPILVLSADDYVTKPFGREELLARIRAALRRSTREPDVAVVQAGDVTIDLQAKVVRRESDEVRLTPTEWHVLEELVRNRGKLVSQRQLLKQVWGPQYDSETNYLRVYVAQLRRKLEADPAKPRYIITEPGMGYRFDT